MQLKTVSSVLRMHDPHESRRFATSSQIFDGKSNRTHNLYNSTDIRDEIYLDRINNALHRKTKKERKNVEVVAQLLVFIDFKHGLA